MSKLTLSLLLAVITTGPGESQSIVAEGNVVSDGQLVSTVATGTAPLAVSSQTMVPNLNADQVDGIEGSALALDTDLQNVEAMLMALEAQVSALGLALVARTGQTTCYDAAGSVIVCGPGTGQGQDGDYQLGVTWPTPRFTKNGNGTVIDNLTGLVWLERANCAGGTGMDWEDALEFSNTLFDGSTAHNGGDCGLSDGSLSGEWRLPNVRELHSLAHYGVFNPALPNTAGTGQWAEGDPFLDVRLGFYWASNTFQIPTDSAWAVNFSIGLVGGGSKASASGRVWPVRGGQ